MKEKKDNKDSYIILEGENYDDVLKRGLDILQLSVDEVEVEVINEKKNFLLGNKKEKVKLKLTPKYSDVKAQDTNKINDRLHEKVSDIIQNTETDRQSLQNHYTGTENNSQNEDESEVVDSIPIIEISRDRLEATLIVTKPKGGKMLTYDDIMEELADRGIVYGVDENQIRNVVNHQWFDTRVTIARGTLPVNGEDGKIIYHFDVEKHYKPQILDDGTVDLKQLNLIQNVQKGDLLAEAIPPTEGEKGYDVLGNEIPPLRGKELKIKKGRNTYESEDHLKLYSNVSGQVYIIDGKIQVSEIYQVPANVDNSTGNIKFNGKVIIRGNVKSGFSVEADGDIEVYGVVEGATLIANGDIILGRGVQGNNQAYLECTGNVISKYIENARIKCNGNVEADFILHSEVVAKGKITLKGKKALIVGGEIKAGDEIRTKVLGSHMGTLTKIEVGIDPEEKSKFEAYRNEIAEIEKNMKTLKMTIELLNRAAKSSQLPKNKEQIFIKSLKTYEFLKNKHSAIMESMNALEFKMQNIARGKVHVAVTVYPGVRVTILNAVRHIYDELSCCTLYRKDGDIVIGPYEK